MVVPVSTHKVVDRAGVACGCEYTRDRRGQEAMSRHCMVHEAEQIAMAAACAAAYAEGVNRELNRDLVGG
jgi:hypothetical protein